MHYVREFTEDVEFTVKQSDLDEWMKDVKIVKQTESAKAKARVTMKNVRCDPKRYTAW